MPLLHRGNACATPPAWRAAAMQTSGRRACWTALTDGHERRPNVVVTCMFFVICDQRPSRRAAWTDEIIPSSDCRNVLLLTYSPNSHGVQNHSLNEGIGNNRQERRVMTCLADNRSP